MASEFDWLPDDGIVLTRADLERLFVDLRALVDGTDALDANRAYVVDVAVTIVHALERSDGDNR